MAITAARIRNGSPLSELANSAASPAKLPFTDAGMETWVAPGVNGWNKVWPDFGVALLNIRNFTRDGQALGAVGQLNTTWDDDGAQRLPNSGWYALLFGAAAAWQPGESSIPDFQGSFGRVFHGDETGRIDQAQQKLIEAHALLRSRGLYYGSDWLFWIDPWNGEGVDAARRLRGIAPQLRVLAEDALRLALAARAAAPREPEALDALELGARKLDLIGQKFEFADQVAQMYARAQQLAARVVSPAVQRTDDVAGIAPAFEHDGLAVAADVGQKLNAVRVADQQFGMVHPRQGVIVARVGHHQFVADVARAVLEQQFLLEFQHLLVEIPGDRKLRTALLEF